MVSLVAVRYYGPCFTERQDQVQQINSSKPCLNVIKSEDFLNL